MNDPQTFPDATPPNGAAEGTEAAATMETETLQARAESAEQKRDEYLDLLQRTKAEFENYQKRNQREREQERRFWHAPLARDLLPVIDNLERATEAAKKAGETGPLVQGVALVQNQLVDMLRRHGITRIEALGKPFDPNLHQAVMQQPSADQPPQTVLQVLEQGFMIHDRVLRPAAVVVAAPV